MSKEKSVNKGAKQLRDIPLSVLDLVPIVVGGTAADSFRNSLDLAQHVEKWGFHRYWLAEHHGMPGVASSATSVVISYIASGTSKIRVGSGGIMLPNHAPLVIAEQFGTLESMYPGRIDLGLGRAPGTDPLTARALRRDFQSSGDDFPELLAELRSYLNPSSSGSSSVRAIPGEGLNIPIWLLGSSGFSARLAGELGLPFAFASHFSPDYTLPALEIYRSSFRPSEVLDEPYVMVGVNVVAADTDEKAQWLATSQELQFLNLLRNQPTPLNPPVENMDEIWNDYEKVAVKWQLRSMITGSPETVKEKLQAFLDVTQADELIIHTQVFDHKARLRSYEILAEIVMGK
ncbi:LLM class flavin-dependent oxidoreductase [Thermaerobacillus caldiproteolyticus]|uniref:Luciferase family oxidoreductase group 1 n=1 Tax=Thermaerobacillus caldiproteolyticus TaxID=247480 RepID=A0A7W0BZQ2_9BACL|nr:LLM class flavin-dependent oxidoreductase [Anoxybacillus caldiproteolyticus]MBA2875860.1 luciferase family oxidoreductase group 1 [Anoxybacillus caldiproteolyticus]